MKFRAFKTRGIARRNSNLDRKSRALLVRKFSPAQALIVNMLGCAICSWCFFVIYNDWSRTWGIFYPMSILIAFPFGILSLMDFWRSGWNPCFFFAFIFAMTGFVFWCFATYLLVAGDYFTHAGHI